MTYLDGAHLTDEQRTEDLLDAHSGDIQHLCGCQFWRDDPPESDEQLRPEYAERIRVQWCARHTPFYMIDDDPTPEETPT